MNIQLITGEFKSEDALELIAQLIQTKIKYHENKISNSEVEEDMKNREAKIKILQNQLHEVRSKYYSNQGKLKINATININ